MQSLDNVRCTAAAYAICATGCVKSLSCLIDEYKAPIACRDDSGNTLAHYAASNGKASCLHFLLSEKLFGVHFRNDDGETILDAAFKGGDVCTIKYLYKINVHHIIDAWTSGQSDLDWQQRTCLQGSYAAAQASCAY